MILDEYDHLGTMGILVSGRRIEAMALIGSR